VSCAFISGYLVAIGVSFVREGQSGVRLHLHFKTAQKSLGAIFSADLGELINICIDSTVLEAQDPSIIISPSKCSKCRLSACPRAGDMTISRGPSLKDHSVSGPTGKSHFHFYKAREELGP
jgi:hypothetical protein